MDKFQCFDVIIVGGSYSGLSAGLALGRSMRKVLILDSDQPCNRQTPFSHNFITQDGVEPSIIAQKAKQQVLSYPNVLFIPELAIYGRKIDTGFEITTDIGNMFMSQKLILATGIKDILPEIKGFAECWGISVIHCPYCQGYEYRNRKTGILANGERAFHIAALVYNLTQNIVIITSGKPEFTKAQKEKFSSHNIQILQQEVLRLEHTTGHLNKVVFKDFYKLELEVLYAVLPFIQHSTIPVNLGCELTNQGYIKVDNFLKTSVKGVYACGDNASMIRSVSNAIASGNLAGAMVNNEITDETF